MQHLHAPRATGAEPVRILRELRRVMEADALVGAARTTHEHLILRAGLQITSECCEERLRTHEREEFGPGRLRITRSPLTSGASQVPTASRENCYLNRLGESQGFHVVPVIRRSILISPPL